ncbi:MAG: PIG-L deacetylase family protein [Alphaproteobacteria bacterium]
MTRSIAVIAAHPDDEVLGFGGIMRRHADAGDRVSVLILASGLAARGEDAATETALAALRQHASDANARLGVARLDFADFPDNRMDSLPLLDVVKRVESFLEEEKPSAVYTHHAGDLNIDHRIAAQAVMTACRPLPGSTVETILAGEVNSATEWAGPQALPFIATEFVDIGATLTAKLEALACYKGELRDWPHPRSLRGVEAQARWRGSQAGFEAAEAFVTLRRCHRGAP